MSLRLYPPVQRSRTSFKDVKSVTVPNQCMTLAEIIKRFVRKESLPIGREGFYEDRMGDLEKLGNEDIVVQLERAADLKSKIKNAEARNAKADADKAAAAKVEADKLAERQSKLDALLASQLTPQVKE